MSTSRELTPREQEVLEALSQWLRDHGYPPSMRELGEEVGLASTRSVHDYLLRLEELGFIRRHRDRSRAIEILREPGGNSALPPAASQRDLANRVTVPIIGEVAAGSPILAVENHEGSMEMDASMVRDSRSYLLKVRGESMIEAHICDGDMVLVEPKQEARNGEVVVVMIEDEVTLKRFYKRDGYIELKPENSAMASILLTPDSGDIRILGKLAGLVRQY